ncbi:uncharacterized protein TNCV_3932871 [Trichonephila clavipes]|nr:uncharacterized protein TNCV_3932871 [Trichonephila clavipes]
MVKDTHDMNKETYGNAAMSKLGVFKWHKLSRVGRERVADDDHSGHPSITKANKNVLRVKDLLNRDCRVDVGMIACEISIPQTQMCEIVTGTLAMSFPRSEVSCPAQCGNSALYPLQLRLGPTRLFSVPKNKIDAEGEASRIGKGGSTGRDL